MKEMPPIIAEAEAIKIWAKKQGFTLSTKDALAVAERQKKPDREELEKPLPIYSWEQAEN